MPGKLPNALWSISATPLCRGWAAALERFSGVDAEADCERWLTQEGRFDGMSAEDYGASNDACMLVVIRTLPVSG